jgi:predicted nucleic-acid-binding Zn-ribbon protein
VKEWRSCPKCGSTDIVPRARIVDRSDSGVGDLSLSFPGARTVGPIRIPKRVALAASVCSSCGYTELYVQRPEEVREARDRARQEPYYQGQPSQIGGTSSRSSQRVFALIGVSLALLLALGIVALILFFLNSGPK